MPMARKEPRRLGGMGSAQGGDLGAPAGQVVLGCFQEEGQVAQRGVIRHGRKGLEADVPLADGGVAILMGTERVLGIVQVDGVQTV